jgi:hypothetical protein
MVPRVLEQFSQGLCQVGLFCRGEQRVHQNEHRLVLGVYLGVAQAVTVLPFDGHMILRIKDDGDGQSVLCRHSSQFILGPV